MACEKIASGTLVMALCSRHRDWGGGTGGGREEEGGEEGGRRGGREGGREEGGEENEYLKIS